MKIRGTKGTFHAKTGSIKGRNGMDLTEAEDIKKSVKEKEMATHSSVLALRFPWTEEPGGLQPMGSHRVGHACRRMHTRSRQVSCMGRGWTGLLPVLQGCFNASSSKKKLVSFRW